MEASRHDDDRFPGDRRHRPTQTSSCSTPGGGRPTTCPSARSTCSTTRCCASRCTLDHVKPRLLGHWGTTPGLNLIYAHLNRVIRARDLDVLYVCGPGHGGPGMVANTYLEGTYSEVYPDIGRDEDGMRRLFRQFSFPGGIPSHAAPETPGLDQRGRRARATRSSTPTAPPSTTPTWWWRA